MNNLSEMKFNVVLLNVSFTPHSDTNKVIRDGAVLVCAADYICVSSSRDTLRLRVKEPKLFRRKRKEKDTTQ